MAEHPFVERAQPPAGPPHPVAERQTVEPDPLPLVDLGLPIQRLVIGEFADQHVGDQGLGGEPAIDRTGRCRRLHDWGVAGATGLARPTEHLHPEERRHDVEHPAHRLADLMQRPAAAGTGLVVAIHHHLDLRQALRQLVHGTLAPPARGCRRVRGVRRHRGLRRSRCGGFGLLEILDRQRQLVGIDLLGARPEPVPLELSDQQMELVDLRAQAGDLARGVGNQLAQRNRIVGQGGKFDRHLARITDIASLRQ